MSSETLPQDMPEDILTDHSYDGIQEYDNPLPGWWKFLFIATVVFSPIYYAYFHFGPDGRSIHDAYNRHMASVFEQKFEEIGELTPDKATLMKYKDDAEWRAVGEVVYKTHCVSCHGADGSGLVGPNLTDEHWKNVKKIEDVARVIRDGAANGAMPAWGNRLSHPNQIVLAAAYVASLRDNPLPGRAPEGEIIPDWNE